MLVDLNLLSKCKQDFDLKLSDYNNMQRYYDGYTDAMLNYQFLTERANNKTNCNYVQKFITEEANYVAGNKISFVSFSNDKNILEAIRLNTAYWSEKHNKELVKQALIFNEAYELYYIDDIKGFSSLICTPLNSYALEDDFGNIQLFIRFFKKKFDITDTLYADVYTDTDIAHYTVSGSQFIQINNDNVDNNFFGKVPIGLVKIGSTSESIYGIIKGLQDGYETNLSDITNEISDFRNAYLKLIGCKLDETQLKDMKKLGVMNIPTKDGNADWLVKSINDSFIQNTLTTLKEEMYELTSHINHNADLASNTSSLAMKNRLIGLQQRCSNIISALEDCIKVRLQFLFNYIYKKTGTSYDFKDVEIKITANLPSDDLMFAQIWSQCPDKISLETGLSQFSFISNPDAEIKQLKIENSANNIGADLLNSGSGGVL